MKQSRATPMNVISNEPQALLVMLDELDEKL
jgi:hypothetical protein